MVTLCPPTTRSTFGTPGRRAALVVGVLWLLVAGNMAVPFVAEQHDFGHRHGTHEPEHVHELDFTLPSPVLQEPVTNALRLPGQVARLQPPQGYLPARPERSRANPIRAPPRTPHHVARTASGPVETMNRPRA